MHDAALFSPLHTHTAGGGSRIALVHDWLTVPAGSEDVFREVCDLYPGTVFTSQWDKQRVRFVEALGVRTSYIDKLPFAHRKHYWYAPLLPSVYRAFDMSGFDVILSDSHSFAHAVRKAVGALHINYYHTPARSLWLPEIDPRASNGKLAWLKRKIAKRLKRLDLDSSTNPDVIFANSRTTADRIRKFYGREVDAVIYPPVDTKKWSKVMHESDELGFLTWGRLIGYKKLDLAIEAVKRTGDKLQIVGSGPMDAELKSLAAGCENIVFHGRLGDEELAKLMRQCRAVLFPGYEDFGIVPVEAMAAGLPVVAFGAGGASETVLPDFGELFHEQSVDALVGAIRSLEGRSFDTGAMRAHAATFDRSRFREQYMAAVESAISEHRGTAERRLAAAA